MTTTDLSLIKTDAALRGILRDERLSESDAIKRNTRLCKRRLCSYIHDNLVMQKLDSMGFRGNVSGCIIHGEHGPKYWFNAKYHPSSCREERQAATN